VLLPKKQLELAGSIFCWLKVATQKSNGVDPQPKVARLIIMFVPHQNCRNHWDIHPEFLEEATPNFVWTSHGKERHHSWHRKTSSNIALPDRMIYMDPILPKEDQG